MKLFFRRYGQGFPVIILHGLFGISDNWVTFARNLSDAYEVFLPDLRNHGQSPHHPVFHYDALTADIAEFAEEHGLEKYFLIGHSLGGKIAMNLAGEYPEQVSKLVIVDIGLRQYSGNREHQALIDAMRAVDFSVVRSRSDVDRQLQTTISSGKLRQFLLKNVYWKDDKTLGWRLNLPAIDASLPQVFEGVPLTAFYPGPSLFVRGALSDYVSDEDVREIKKQFPGAVVRTLDGAGHWVHADAPGEFYSIVRGFLDA